jgi:hypothetical protein
MTMIEKVARALAKVYARGTGDDEVAANRYADSFWRKFKDDARAAIEAMREPTDAMLGAGEGETHDDPAPVWAAMIDRALSEGEG